MNLDYSLAERAIRFISNLTLSDEFRGEPFRLMEYQKDFIRKMLAIDPKTGKVVVKKVFLALGRKNAKSQLIAGLALFFAFGAGRKGQEIICAASDRDQASIIFNKCKEMIEADPWLDDQCKIYSATKTIVTRKTGNKIFAISSIASTKHGKNPSVVLMDEVHTLPNRELWDTLNSAFGARRGNYLFIAITTAGDDRESLCFQEWEYARNVKNGLVEDPEYLPLLYELPEDEDWTVEDNWYKAMPGLGTICDLAFIRSEFKKAQDSPAEEAKFRRLYLNQWISSTKNKAFHQQKWKICTEIAFDIDSLMHQECFMGIDLSAISDITAVVLAFPPTADRPYWVVIPKFWVAGSYANDRVKRDKVPYDKWIAKGKLTAIPGDIIDYDFVKKEVLELCKQYDVRRIMIDSYNATQFTIGLMEEGLPVEFHGQSFPDMNAPTKELLRLVISQEIAVGDNPVLTWMASNAILANDSNGNVKISKTKSADKVDGLVALVMAINGKLSDFGLPQVISLNGSPT